MPLNRPRFDVYINGTDEEPTEHAVTVTHQDQLRAEAMLSGMGIDTQGRALALTTAWCWAALYRTEEYKGPFKRFHDIDCAGIESPQDGEASDEADPTRLADDTASSSPSPASGPASTG